MFNVKCIMEMIMQIQDDTYKITPIKLSLKLLILFEYICLRCEKKIIENVTTNILLSVHFICKDLLNDNNQRCIYSHHNITSFLNF